MSIAEIWRPPGKNCGLCGSKNCREFINAVVDNEKFNEDCPFYGKRSSGPDGQLRKARYTGKDVLGHTYDFILKPLPGELSPRKIVLPFRSDLVEKLALKKGDLIIGRPMGAGCPIPHVLKIRTVDEVSGVLDTWVVGPRESREQEVTDVRAYHMIGFEGLAEQILKEPVPGARATFLPGCCMMNLNHTGLVNMVLEKNAGLQVRIEDIRILASV